MPDFTVTVDWGARSEQLRVLHGAKSASFLLAKVPLPVAMGAMKITDTGVAWEIAPLTPLTVTPVPGTSTAATVLVPDGTVYLRLDFKLDLTIGKTTATCLEFRQLLGVGPGGSLLPQQYAIEDFAWTAGSPAPTRTPGPALSGRRSFLGTCPLLRVLVNRLEINCEFLDVTEIWWALWATNDVWGWYLDPDLGGRPDLFRVLAWTSGTHPMLWFVAVSDLAATGRRASPPTPPPQPSSETTAAEKSAPDEQPPAPPARPGSDIVFFRPITGDNSFRYKADESGFTDTRHGDITAWNLARWLLRPLPHALLKAKRAAMGTATFPLLIELAGMRVLPAVAPPPTIAPADPLDRIQEDVSWAFRLVGLEAALARSPCPDVIFLPLGSEAAVYPGLIKKSALRDTIESARALLWVRGATGRDRTATPSFDRRIWLAGHSAENRAMFACLRGNALAVNRIISYDATPAKDLLIPEGIPSVTAAAKERSAVGLTLKAVFVTTPNLWADKKAEYQSVARQLVATKADVTLLPSDAEWDDYWKHPPTATSNPHVFEVLREWDGFGLATSVRFGKVHPAPPGKSWQWLFWHEWAVHGGHLVPDPTTGGQRVRTFLEDVFNMP